MVTRNAGVGRGLRHERGRAMAKRMLTTAITSGVAVAAVVSLMVTRTPAEVIASDRTANYVVYIDVQVDAVDQWGQGRRVDTVLQLTNTATAGCRTVQCVYVNATKHCSNAPALACRTNSDCEPGASCGISDCSETNFTIALSAGQAIGWSASLGGTVPRDDVTTPPCDGGVEQPILGVPGDVFQGELKCVELSGPDGTPINANDLKGEATIYQVSTSGAGVDVRSYNAVGFRAIATDGLAQSRLCVGGSAQGNPCTAPGDCAGGSCDTVMCLGQTNDASGSPAAGAVCRSATHASCPATLLFNHWFDGVPNPITNEPFRTDLTLVPCSEDLTATGPSATPATAVQFLVFNEFEQRFSASMSLTCYSKTRLSQIDVRPGNESYSIWNVAVQGTWSGQTRIRPVPGNELDKGHGLVGIFDEASGFTIGTAGGPFVGSSAANLDFVGTSGGNNSRADVVTLAPPP